MPDWYFVPIFVYLMINAFIPLTTSGGWRGWSDFIAVSFYLLGVVPLLGMALLELGVIDRNRSSEGKIKLHASLVALFLVVAHVAIIFGMLSSLLKGVLFGAVVYGALFLGGPLVCTKGWRVVCTPGFVLPLLLAIVALGARPFLRQLALVPILALAYLHWRYDLSELGLRSRRLRGDVTAVLLLGLVAGLPGLIPPHMQSHALLFDKTAFRLYNTHS